MQEARGVVAEDVDVAAFVAGGSEAAVWALVFLHQHSHSVVRTRDSIPDQYTSQNSPS